MRPEEPDQVGRASCLHPAADPWAPVRTAMAGVTLPLTLNRLRGFVAGNKPTRSQLRPWVKALLDAHDAVRDANERQKGIIGRMREAVEKAEAEIDAVRAQRDEALEQVRGVTAVIGERDELRARVCDVTKAYEEVRAAYESAENEVGQLRGRTPWNADRPAHPDYVLLRLTGGRPEIVAVDHLPGGGDK